MNQPVARPLITTVIPTYRRPKQLQRAIQSVLNQTYSNIQVRVYDNHSGDETSLFVQRIAQTDPRVKYHCHTENMGPLKNFIFGMERVETPFFSFLSDDDVLLPEFYQTAIEGFIKFPDAIFFGGATIAMTAEGLVRDVSSMWQRGGYYSPPDGLFEMLENNLAWTSVLFRKEVIDEVGSLDLEVGGPTDLDFLLRIAARFPFVVSREPSAIWLDSHDTVSGRADSKFVWPGWLKMIRNLTQDQRIPLHIRSRAEQILTSQLQRKLFGIGSNLIRQKKFEDAYQVASILRRNCRQSAKANLIFFTTWCCKHLPLGYIAILFMNRLRKVLQLRNLHVRNLQKQFGNYARFLRTEDSV
jgi:glycosyltransferase involved in cell wall biosynthesis